METIIKMYQHLDWANQRIIETLQRMGDQSNQAKQLFSHLLLAEEVWVNRLKGLDSNPQAIWTELSLAECANLVEKNKQNYAGLLTGLTERQLKEVIVYKTSSGIEFSTPVGDILTHVALHGQYHRGQINQRLREEGHEPINVDYIMFVR